MQSSSTSAGMSAGAIAGAVVACVLGLGTIAALCTYFFWLRPKQQVRKEEQDEVDAAAAKAQAPEERRKRDDLASTKKQEESDDKRGLPAELQSLMGMSELASATLSEAPGDEGSYELSPDTRPVELPGDREGYRRISDGSSSGHKGVRILSQLKRKLDVFLEATSYASCAVPNRENYPATMVM